MNADRAAGAALKQVRGAGRHFTKLARSVYSGPIAADLREAIIAGELAEGTPLVETRLAEELAVSRGPVRSALHVLEGEGLVRTMPNGRMVAVGFHTEDLRDLLDVRYELESLAITKGIANETNPRPVADAFATMLGEGASTLRLVDLDVDFHRTLVEFSGSRFLVQSWLAVAPVIHTVITIGNRTLVARDPQSNFDRIVSSHRTLVDAVCASNVDAATAMLAEQFRFTSSMFSGRDGA